jgi:hypothetical protein
MSSSTGLSKSKNKSRTSENVWGPQGDALEGLYGSASDLFGNMNDYYGQMNQQASNLQPYNRGIMDRSVQGQEHMMGGGAYGDTQDARSMLMNSLGRSGEGSNLGRMYESIVGGKGNTYIDPMVDAMKSSGMDNLKRMQSGTGLDAAAMGQGGSSRHAMQNAMQSRDMNRDMMDRETMMRGGAYDTDMGMKLDIARQADTGVQNTQRNLMQMLSGADRNINMGMNQGGNMQNLGMGSMAPTMTAAQAPWDMLNQYSNVIGDPTVLGSGRSSGSSFGANRSSSLKG